MSSTLVSVSVALSRQLADGRDAVRAAAQRSGSAMNVVAVGEVDVGAEAAWKLPVNRVGSAANAPRSAVVDVQDLSLGCCGFAGVSAEIQQYPSHSWGCAMSPVTDTAVGPSAVVRAWCPLAPQQP